MSTAADVVSALSALANGSHSTTWSHGQSSGLREVGALRRSYSKVHGQATNATVSYTSGFEFNWEFATLRPRDYGVWSYAWAPDSPLYFKTRVVVTGSADPAQVVGGLGWGGTFVLGKHYARHVVTVGSNGNLEIVFSVAVSACTVNGIQLRELAPPPEVYCSAGTSSQGCVAAIQGVGTPSASASNGFVITASNVEGQRAGTVFYGASGRVATPWGTGTSYLCVASPVQRTPTGNSGGAIGACDGALALDWNAYMASHSGALAQPRVTGQVLQAQAWYRDPTAPKTSNLSDALEFTLAP